MLPRILFCAWFSPFVSTLLRVIPPHGHSQKEKKGRTCKVKSGHTPPAAGRAILAPSHDELITHHRASGLPQTARRSRVPALSARQEPTSSRRGFHGGT